MTFDGKLLSNEEYHSKYPIEEEHKYKAIVCKKGCFPVTDSSQDISPVEKMIKTKRSEDKDKFIQILMTDKYLKLSS